MGHSVGHWEGDTLVVDTIGFSEQGWIASGSFPQTEKLHVTERFRRPTSGIWSARSPSMIRPRLKNPGP
jgi:hypothetical protein